MLPYGIYPASVTPFTQQGKPDWTSLARLLAWFEASGCQGVVLAGTNGEGPSLSAVEKRDMVRQAMGIKGNLEIILGISTPSLDEAIWLCRQAAQSSASAVLLMAPNYFRSASEDGIRRWFVEVLDASPVPVILYNFPKMAGFSISAPFLSSVIEHQNAIGVKDSSGERSNLAEFRSVVPASKLLFVGDETLLLEALRAGWSGSISGSANVVPQWLAGIMEAWKCEAFETAESRFKILVPVLQRIRASQQPATHKAVLQHWRMIESNAPRLPLFPADRVELEALEKMMEEALGITVKNLGI